MLWLLETWSRETENLVALFLLRLSTFYSEFNFRPRVLSAAEPSQLNVPFVLEGPLFSLHGFALSLETNL